MYSNLSGFGRRAMTVYVILLVVDIVVLALAAQVNIYQEFFFMADLFPFALSIASLVCLGLLIASNLVLHKTFIARPTFHVALLTILTIVWLAFNAFSTSRWRNIPFPCSTVPAEYPDVRAWCQEVQALKSFVWILFVGNFITLIFIAHYVVDQHRHGNRHIWRLPLMCFDPRASGSGHGHARSISRLDGRMTVTDYFSTTGSTTVAGIDTKW